MRLAVALLIGAAFVQAQAPKPIRLEGRVVSVSGEAVSRATVSLRPVDGTVVAGTMPNIATDDEGKFVIDDVPAGRYTLAAQKAGFLVPGSLAAPSMGAMLNLTAGTELKDLIVKLTPQGVISGKITDQDGDPIAGAQVQVMRYNYVRGRRSMTTSAGVTTNDQGDYRVGNLAPGKYYVGVADTRALQSAVTGARPGRAELESTVPTFYPSAMEAENGTALEVTAGAELQGIDIRMRKVRVYTVKGTMVNPAGAPTGGTRMLLFPKGSDAASIDRVGNFSAALVQPDGTFEFRGLRAGVFELFTVSGQPSPTGGASPSFTAKMEVTVTASNVEGLVATLVPLGEIAGTVRVDEGQKLPRINIRLVQTDGVPVSSPRAQAKDDGSFQLTAVGTSTFFFNVTGVPDRSYVKSIRFAGKDVTRLGIDNTSGAGGTMQIVISSKVADLSRILDGEKKRGSVVTLWPKIPDLGADTGGVRLAYTDQDGGFKFNSLAPGEYYVAAWEELDQGLAQGSAEFLAHFNGDASSIKLDESAHATIDPKLIPPERVAAEIAKLQ
jgi:hypothetical protein